MTKRLSHAPGAWVILLVALCAATDSTARAAEQLRRQDQWMIDGAGRVVLPHGVNAVWKLRPDYSPPATAGGFTADDARWLRENGFNSVRLGVLFAGVMPTTRGLIDPGYLTAIDRVVQLLAAEKIWVLLDFHQDMYNEKFQGEGFPDWAIYDDGIPPHYFFGFPGNYFTPGLTHTFDNLWFNHQQIWDDYRDAWKAVAGKWQDQDHLMGYDLMNEPWPGTQWETCANPLGCPIHDTLQLQAFQEHVLTGIRQVDGGNIVWFEPNVIFNSGAKTDLALVNPIRREDGSAEANLGLSWHNYCLPAGLVHANGVQDVPGCDLLHRIPFDNAKEAIARMAATALVTEFGASDDLADLRQVTGQADEYLTGWLYWHYKNWGDPTTESQGTSGQSLFTRDDTPSEAILKPDKAKILIRTYPQATAGIPLALSFDPQSGAFAYEYQPRAASGPTEIFVPASRHYPAGYVVDVSGGSVTGTTAAGSGSDVVSISADPGATNLKVTISRKP